MPESPKEIETGTTTLGIVAKEGVVLAADRRATAGTMIAHKRTKKVYRLDTNLGLTTAGLVGDLQLLARYITAEVELYKLKRNTPMPVEACATLTANILAGRRYFPYWVQLVIGGEDVTHAGLLALEGGEVGLGRRHRLRRPEVQHQVAERHPHPPGIDGLREPVRLRDPRGPLPGRHPDRPGDGPRDPRGLHRDAEGLRDGRGYRRRGDHEGRVHGALGRGDREAKGGHEAELGAGSAHTITQRETTRGAPEGPRARVIRK